MLGSHIELSYAKYTTSSIQVKLVTKVSSRIFKRECLNLANYRLCAELWKQFSRKQSVWFDPIDGRTIIKRSMETIEQKVDGVVKTIDGLMEAVADLKVNMNGVREQLGTAEVEGVLQKRIRGDIQIMFDQYIGSVNANYDSVAGRVKTLENKTQHLPNPKVG